MEEVIELLKRLSEWLLIYGELGNIRMGRGRLKFFGVNKDYEIIVIPVVVYIFVNQ